MSLMYKPKPWMEDAACREAPPILFFPERLSRYEQITPSSYDAAREYCERCPVLATCREASIDEIHGFWGGLTPQERRELRMRRRRLKKLFPSIPTAQSEKARELHAYQ